jgi:hypothetical protein
LDRVVVVAKVLRALRETLLALEARTMAERGLAMACFEVMVAVYGQRWWCRWWSGNIVIIAVVAVHFYAAVSVAANALVISNAALGRRRARLLPLAKQSSPPPSFDFVLRR